MLKRTFQCMASPCEIHLDSTDPILMNRVEKAVVGEARRIEAKYSRYRDDSVLAQILNSRGEDFEVDEETAKLLSFARVCFEISGGLLDITTGVLRKIWSFKGDEGRVPTQSEINGVKGLVGLNRLIWNDPVLRLPKGMELDFGGIGKEYAVDRCVLLAAEITPVACLINFGGDLAALKAPKSGAWSVGIEGSREVIHFKTGGLATSGDERRYARSGTTLYSHILNPLTGWAVVSPYVSITVQSDTCTNAGIIATLAHLQEDPRAFLLDQGFHFWTRMAAVIEN
jgi:FAD:protein FMN transferase